VEGYDCVDRVQEVRCRCLGDDDMWNAGAWRIPSAGVRAEGPHWPDNAALYVPRCNCHETYEALLGTSGGSRRDKEM
jgi:hypothetical protein